MNITITYEELKKAMAEMDVAVANGFVASLAVFKLSEAGDMLSQCRMKYSDLIPQGSDTDGRYQWGRGGYWWKTRTFKSVQEGNSTR